MRLRHALCIRPLLVFCLLVAGNVFAQTPFPCPDNSSCITVSSQGWIVGEVRTFAFGGDSQKAIDQLAALGWVECAGQSAIRKDFDELWRVVGTDWGTADKQNVFYLPDFRGLFLRGWNHGKHAPLNYKTQPYQGDLDASARVSPRPEAGAAGGNSGASGDHVGSLQADQVGPHRHRYTYTTSKRLLQSAYNAGAKQITMAVPTSAQGITGGPEPGGKETRPSNAYVMYFIYVGKPAQVIEPSAQDAAKGETGRIVCKYKGCRQKP